MLWCMNIANFIFIAVEEETKIKMTCDEEQDHAPESVWVHVEK